MKKISLKVALTAMCLAVLAGITNTSLVAEVRSEPSFSAFTEGISSFQDDRDKKEAASIAKAVGKKMNFFESANFTWCTSLPKGKMTKIMGEAERCYKMFAADAGYKSWKKFWADGRKCMGVILSNKRDYRKYVKWYSKNHPVWNKEQFVKNHSSANWFTEPASRNVMVTHLKPNDAVFVAAVMCHLVGHHCVDRHKANNNFTPGWLRESMGLFFQGEVHGRLQCASYDDPYGLGEGDEARQKGLKKAEFKTRVKKSMAKNRLRNTKNIFQLSTMQELTFLDTQKGHLIVSWMMKNQKKGSLSKFIHTMKNNWPATIVMENTKSKEKAQEKALKIVFNLTPPEADKALKKFAKSGY